MKRIYGVVTENVPAQWKRYVLHAAASYIYYCNTVCITWYEAVYWSIYKAFWWLYKVQNFRVKWLPLCFLIYKSMFHIYVWMKNMIRCPSCMSPSANSNSWSQGKRRFLLDLLLMYSVSFCVYVFVYPSDKFCTCCCDKDTFAGCTSRSLLLHLRPNSSLPFSLCVAARHLVSLTHTGLQHRCLGPLCMCASVFAWISVCVCAPPASPQQDCQSVCDYTPTQLFCFLTISLPRFLFHSSFCRLIKSMMFHVRKWGRNYNILHLVFVSEISHCSLLHVLRAEMEGWEFGTWTRAGWECENSSHIVLRPRLMM